MAAAMPAGAQAGLERPIDLVHLSRATLGDRALEREVLGLFVRQSAIQIEKLKGAADSKAFRMAAHTLKGSAQGVGAHAVAMLAAEAEGIDPADVVGSRQALARLEARIAEAHLYIAGLMAG